MTAALPALAKLRPNPQWAKLPLFDRKGWKTVRFGEVVENLNETCDPEETGLERFIGLEHLEPGSLHIRAWGNVVDGTTFTRRCRPGQVLFGKRRAYQRKVAVAEFDAVVSGDIYVLAPKGDRLLPELVPFLCLSERFFQHAVGTSAGSLSPRTNWSSLASFEFVLPPLDQQRRIAGILWAIDEVCVTHSAQAAALESSIASLRAELLAGSFGRQRRSLKGNGHIPTSHPAVRLADVLTITAGNAFKSEDFCPAGVQLIRLGNLYEGRLDLSRSQVFLPESFLEKYSDFILRPGDILFSMTGTMGKEDYAYAVVVPEATPPTFLNQRVAKLVPKSDVHPEYLIQCLRSRLFLDQIYSKAAGSKQANVSNKDIYSTLTPLPPLKEQQEIAAQLDRFERARSDVADATRCSTLLLAVLNNTLV